ncbi:MAG TPA: hypothetical protein VFN24_06395 [Microbacterium sp.]|nr:hypothetical protein [Microbacterium sp.]
MSAPQLDAVHRLLHADLAGWAGLPALSPDESIAAFGVDPRRAPVNRDARGDPPAPGGWIAIAASGYARGVRLWLDDDRRIVLVHGVWPRRGAEPIPAPDLGPADELLDAELGGLVQRHGERVHATRGLALRVAPATGELLEVLAFAPTSPEDYRARLRPALPVDEPLLNGGRP